MFRTDFGTIHDCMTPVKLERVIQFSKSFLCKFITKQKYYDTGKLSKKKTTNKDYFVHKMGDRGRIGGRSSRKKLHRKTFCAKYKFLDSQSNIIVCIIIVRIINIYTNS